MTERLGVAIDEDGFETVGGYVLSRAGRVPLPGETFEADGLAIHVLEAERRRADEQKALLDTMADLSSELELSKVLGAVLGSVYINGSKYFLNGNWQLIASGAGVLLILWIYPGGLGGMAVLVRDTYLRWVAERRNLVVDRKSTRLNSSHRT